MSILRLTLRGRERSEMAGEIKRSLSCRRRSLRARLSRFLFSLFFFWGSPDGRNNRFWLLAIKSRLFLRSMLRHCRHCIACASTLGAGVMSVSLTKKPVSPFFFRIVLSFFLSGPWGAVWSVCNGIPCCFFFRIPSYPAKV